MRYSLSSTRRIASTTRPHSCAGGQLAAAGGREAIGLHAPALGEDPLADNGAVLLETMQGRKERSGLDAERAARDLLDPIGDRHAVPRLQLERAENE